MSEGFKVYFSALSWFFKIQINPSMYCASLYYLQFQCCRQLLYPTQCSLKIVLHRTVGFALSDVSFVLL